MYISEHTKILIYGSSPRFVLKYEIFVLWGSFGKLRDDINAIFVKVPAEEHREVKAKFNFALLCTEKTS